MSSLIYAGTSSVVAGGFGNGASGHEEERGHAVNENAKGRDPDDRRAGNRRRRLEPAQCLKRDRSDGKQSENHTRPDHQRYETRNASATNSISMRPVSRWLRQLDDVGAARDYGEKNGYDAILKLDSKGWGGEKFQERIFRAHSRRGFVLTQLRTSRQGNNQYVFIRPG